MCSKINALTIIRLSTIMSTQLSSINHQFIFVYNHEETLKFAAISYGESSASNLRDKNIARNRMFS